MLRRIEPSSCTAGRVRACSSPGVSAIGSGNLLTPMRRAGYTEKMLEKANRRIPRRRDARPAELEAPFAFLASDDAACVTGGVYTIDGAETAGWRAVRTLQTDARGWDPNSDP